MKALDKYRMKYGHYNEDTLKVASLDVPELLKEIILDDSIRSFSRSFALIALAEGSREEYFEFIKSFTKSTCPFMSEASFIGLFQYHEEYDLKPFFIEALQGEYRHGVRKQIQGLIENLDFYKEDL